MQRCLWFPGDLNPVGPEGFIYKVIKLFLSLATKLSSNGYTVQIITLFQAVCWPFIWRRLNFLLTRGDSDWNSKPKFKFKASENETEMSRPITSWTFWWVSCVEQVLALSWIVTTYGSTETVGKLCVNRSSLRPLLWSQVLSSLLSASSDCSHFHTTPNNLSALHNLCMRTGGCIFSAPW